MAIQSNETDLYGYVDETRDTALAFLNNKNALLDWNYGLEITKLVQASYMAAERKQTIDLTDPVVQKELMDFHSLVAQGRGGEILFS